MRSLFGVATLIVIGCATTSGPRPAPPRELADARAPVALLQDGNFDEAERAARLILLSEPRNSRLNL